MTSALRIGAQPLEARPVLVVAYARLLGAVIAFNKRLGSRLSRDDPRLPDELLTRVAANVTESSDRRKT